MIAVRVELLTGRYAASRFNDRNAAEWPPHPARLYSAMVATWADAEDPDVTEREALIWFESLGAPEIVASPAARRSPVTFFVPNNEAGAAVASDQSRSYDKLARIATDLAAAGARLARDPADPKARKEVEKQSTLLARLQAKIRDDSRKGSGARSNESPGVVSGGMQLLPAERGKQGRGFPVVIPHDPVVVFAWPEAEPTGEQRRILDGLLARVARLGHSSSMVSCRLVDEAPAATLVPAADGATVIRVTAPGLLEELEIAYARHQAIEPRVLPSILASYRRRTEAPTPVARPYLGADWVVLRDIGADALPLWRALDVTVAVRRALLSFAEEPMPEILSGHQPGDEGVVTPPSQRPHMAVVALPFVGRAHSDGGIRGVGLVLPREASAEDRSAVAGAIRRWVDASAQGYARVLLGPKGTRRLEISDLINPSESLNPRTWCRPAATWVSTTPVALDRHAGAVWNPNAAKREAAETRAVETVKQACADVGLPRPAEVDILRAGPLAGVPDLRRFPTYKSPGRGVLRMLVHVRIVFEQPVAGPIIIGAGRYFGYGLLHPVASARLAAGLAVTSGAVGSGSETPR